MASRHADWLKQGQRDLEHARRALAGGDCEWACFAAQQGAEKAVKAVIQNLGGTAWGHSVTALLLALPETTQPGESLLDSARELDRHYISARYPNAHPEGPPYENYTRGEAERAVANSELVIRFCAGVLARPAGDLGRPPESSAGTGRTLPGD
jgi:HEPN domain-containing protein